MKKQKRFELIELAMVVTIIFILAIIAIPNYFNLQKRARADFIVKEAKKAQSEIQAWIAAINGGGTVDFNGDGKANLLDEKNGPKRLSEIPMVWDIVHGSGGFNEVKSPYNNTEPLFSRFAEPGTGKIRVICPESSCRILGYTNNPEDDAIVDIWVK